MSNINFDILIKYLIGYIISVVIFSITVWSSREEYSGRHIVGAIIAMIFYPIYWILVVFAMIKLWEGKNGKR
jgi:hypothetical protein